MKKITTLALGLMLASTAFAQKSELCSSNPNIPGNYG